MAASGGHLLHQQKSSVETRIKTLVNNDLKEICRAYNYQVSGQKSALQKRCTESEDWQIYECGRSYVRRARNADGAAVLDTIVRDGDVAAFRDLNYRVNNHGKAPPPQLQQHYTQASTTTNGYGSFQSASSTMPQGRAMPPTNGTHRASASRMCESQCHFQYTTVPCADTRRRVQNKPVL